MAHITISAGTNGEKTTVSEMRRRLARVLAKLDGNQEVSFSFAASCEHYRVAVSCCKSVTVPKALGAPYDLAKRCSRCGFGIDHDGDGNGGVCAKKTDAEMPYCDADERFLD